MPTRVWVIRAGKGGKYADLFWARSIVALAVDFRADASEATAAGLTEAGVAAGNAPPVAALLRRFALELEVGDVVVCPVSGQKRYMIGRVASDYRFVDDEGDTGLHHLAAKPSADARISDDALLASGPGATHVTRNGIGRAPIARRMIC
jgi:predicted Mrr-cat superfamily restriction endonuclease